MMENQHNSKSATCSDGLTVEWLYNHGYTLQGAGKELGLTGSHIGKVLRGERESLPLLERLRALPKRKPVKPTIFLPEFK